MFSTPDPTPEQSKLHGLKMRVFKAIEPYHHRVARKDWNAFQIALKFCTGTNQVEALYRTWQQKLSFKNIADLPDLDQPKPKQLIAAA